MIDPDVRKYINEVKINITRIKQPDDVREIYAVLKQIYLEILDRLKKSGIFAYAECNTALRVLHLLNVTCIDKPEKHLIVLGFFND